MAVISLSSPRWRPAQLLRRGAAGGPAHFRWRSTSCITPPTSPIFYGASRACLSGLSRRYLTDPFHQLIHCSSNCCTSWRVLRAFDACIESHAGRVEVQVSNDYRRLLADRNRSSDQSDQLKLILLDDESPRRIEHYVKEAAPPLYDDFQEFARTADWQLFIICNLYYGDLFASIAEITFPFRENLAVWGKADS